MTPSALPTVELVPLPRADGSSTYSHDGYTVTAVVNGPVEAQRRDEHAFEALIDVNVRPAAGVGGTAERQLETILQSALRQLIPVRDFPRTMIQITLQMVGVPENIYENSKVTQAHMNLLCIPALLHSAVIGLLTAAVPLKCYATAVVAAVSEFGEVIIGPTPAQATLAQSTHALGFTSGNELLLLESEGSSSVDEIKSILVAGERMCCQQPTPGANMTMANEHDGSSNTSIRQFIRSVMETKTAADLHWK